MLRCESAMSSSHVKAVSMPSAGAQWSARMSAEIGKASGAFNMFRFLGGAFGIASLVAVFDHAGGLSSPQAFSSGFAAVLGVAAALSAAGAIAGLWLPGRRQVARAPASAATAQESSL